MFGLTPGELELFKQLNTPEKIQDHLDALPFNHERKEETHFSPRRVLQQKRAHCIEGALLAATALWLAGERPLIMDLKARRPDDDHVVTLFKRNGYWGAISKTNHAVLRFRDPIYPTLHALALSYFHEYFLNDTGEKMLRSYSRPLNLARYGKEWITTEEDLWWLDKELNALTHTELVPKENARYVRGATAIERRAGHIVEFPNRA